MSWLFHANTLPLLTPTIFAILLAVVFKYLHYMERERCLALWSLAWLIFGLRYVLEGGLQNSPAPVLVAASQLTAAASAFLLLLGTCDFSGRSIRPSMTVLAVVAGIYGIAAPFSGASLMLVSAPVYAFVGLAHIWSGVILLRYRTVSGLGRQIVALALIAWGAHKLDYPLLRPMEEFATLGFVVGAALMMLVGTGLVVVYFEIAKSRLNVSRERFQNMLEGVHLIAIILDRDFRTLFCNDYLTSLTGWGKEEVLGSDWFSMMVPAEESERIVRELEEHIENSCSASYHENDIVTRNGDRLRIRWHNTFLRNRDGLVTGFAALGEDLTGRRKAESGLARLGTAIEQAAEAVIITDTGGYIKYVNPAFEKMSGYEADEVLGLRASLLKSGAQDEGFYRELWQTIIAGRTWKGSFVNLRKDGSRFEQETTISPVRDESGEIVGFVSLARDVTRERELEMQLLHSQKMEAVGSLAGGVAHDFNNLLTVIFGYADLAMLRLGEGDRGYSEIMDIRDAAARARDLTTQLLAFSRRQTLEMRVLDVAELVRGLSKMLRRLIGENISLEIRCPERECFVKADSGQLQQVVMNLAINARDAMPGGGDLLIELECDVSPDRACESDPDESSPVSYLMLSVSDTGMGMDEQTRKRIFEPFFTTKERGKGTGLGLSTVHGIVSQHGGRIRVGSRPGRGTVFEIFLPEVDRATAGDEMQEKGEPVRISRGGETVLLVEDDEMVRKLTATILEENGFRVLKAGSGEEALALLGDCEKAPAVMLADVIMPGLRAGELEAAARKLCPGIEVLYMSGYTEDIVAGHGIRQDACHLIRKPFSAATLLSKIEEVLTQQ